MEKIVIGKILKPQGIKGQLKVSPITQDINRYKKLGKVYIDEVDYSISSVLIRDGYVYINFTGLNDRNSVEHFRNKYICVDRENAIKLPNNCWFIQDLVGCNVFDEHDLHLGCLTDVLQNGCADVYVIDDGKIMFPALNKLLLNVDTDSKKIVVSSNILKEVCVYED